MMFTLGYDSWPTMYILNCDIIRKHAFIFMGNIIRPNTNLQT